MRMFGVLGGCILGLGCAAAQQQVPAEYQRVLAALGRTGDFKENVLKINIPRNDLKVAVEGQPMPGAFGFGGWVSMTKDRSGQEVAMGDLVLLQQEVNPVLSALLDNGLEVTALHNHFFFEEPRIFYMHVMGHGSAADLARRLKPGLDLIGHVPASARPATDGAAPGGLDTARIARTVGHTGESSGPVYKITVGRPDIHETDMGAAINSRMGLNTWAAFTGSDQQAAIAGDVAMLEDEVQPVLKTLRAHGLEVVAIHQHMIGAQPNVIFLHYFGRGAADKLAAAFRATLDQLGKHAVAMRH